MRIDAAAQANQNRMAQNALRAMQPQQQAQQIYTAPTQNVMASNNNRSGLESAVTAVEWAVIGYAVGTGLKNYPWFRALVAALLGYIGIALIVHGMWWGLVFLGLAALLLVWAHKPVRARAAASSRFTALSSPEAVEHVMVGTAVTQGPAIGWAIKVAQVVPNTFRAAQGQVWADVDIILANGDAVAASFHADTSADAWTWAARS